MFKNLFFLLRPLIGGVVGGTFFYFSGILLSRILPGNVEKDPFVFMVAGFGIFLLSGYYFIPLLRYFYFAVRKSGGVIKALNLDHAEFVERLVEEANRGRQRGEKNKD